MNKAALRDTSKLQKMIWSLKESRDIQCSAEGIRGVDFGNPPPPPIFLKYLGIGNIQITKIIFRENWETFYIKLCLDS